MLRLENNNATNNMGMSDEKKMREESRKRNKIDLRIWYEEMMMFGFCDRASLWED